MKKLLAVLFTLPHLLNASPLMLAKNHHENIDITQYLVSEKLDGVRARWTGEHLLSRYGNKLHAPEWFTQPLPNTMLDGELWIGRGQFQQITKIVLDDAPDEEEWKKVRFMIFDLPEHPGPFSERAIDMNNLVSWIDVDHVRAVKHSLISDHDSLIAKLKFVESEGGEGLMLHHCENLYKNGRSAGLLKMKSFDDAEATVIAHHPGKGKYTDMLGSLEVETENGIRFKLGTGFDNFERQNPPTIGSLVTYKYYGLTDSGKPRFASFLRERTDFEQQ